MCPKVSDEANPVEEAVPTSRAVVGWCQCGSSRFGLACGSFLLYLEGSVLFRCGGFLGDDAAPAGSVGVKWLPRLSADIEVFQRAFETVLEAFTLASDCAFAMTEFSVEEMLGDAVVMHSGDMACPSQLGLACDGSDAGETCPLQNLCGGNFVLQRMYRRLRRHLRWKWLKIFLAICTLSRFLHHRGGEDNCPVDF